MLTHARKTTTETINSNTNTVNDKHNRNDNEKHHKLSSTRAMRTSKHLSVTSAVVSNDADKTGGQRGWTAHEYRGYSPGP